MKNIWIMTWFTLREALARKVFIFFLTISAVVLVIMAVVFGLSDKASFTMNVSGGNMQFTNPINMIEMMIVSPLSGLCLLWQFLQAQALSQLCLKREILICFYRSRFHAINYYGENISAGYW